MHRGFYMPPMQSLPRYMRERPSPQPPSDARMDITTHVQRQMEVCIIPTLLLCPSGG